MYDNLLEELADRGLTWSRGGLASQHWRASEETCYWILDTAQEIITGYNPQNPESFPDVEPRALVLMSQACMALIQHSDGVASKDLAMIAFQIEMERGQFDLEMMILAQHLMANGRYVDCVGYFHARFDEGEYDESFLPDVIEVLDDLEQWYQKLISEQTEWGDEEFREESYFQCLALMIKIARGAYLQLEMGLRVMNKDQVLDFLEQLAPRAATISLHFVKFERLSNFMYSISHTFAAYSTFILGAFRVQVRGSDVPMHLIVESVKKGCLDNADLTPEERYYTLFAQILRLRVLSQKKMDASTEDWGECFNRAEKALAESAKINAYDTYAQIIENIKEEGRILDMQNYADKLGRSL